MGNEVIKVNASILQKLYISKNTNTFYCQQSITACFWIYIWETRFGI